MQGVGVGEHVAGVQRDAESELLCCGLTVVGGGQAASESWNEGIEQPGFRDGAAHGKQQSIAGVRDRVVGHGYACLLQETAAELGQAVSKLHPDRVGSF